MLRRAIRSVPIGTIALRASALDRARGLLRPETRLVIVAGFAGGLSPELACGDVIVDDPPEGFLPPAGCVVGTIHTAGAIVSTPGEKQRLRAQTGAIAVDMELSIVREALRERSLRVVGVRAILDTASQTLPQWLSGAVGDMGEAKVGALARAIARDPRRIAQLLWLARASRRAGRGLARAMATLVEQQATGGASDRAVVDLMT